MAKKRRRKRRKPPRKTPPLKLDALSIDDAANLLRAAGSEHANAERLAADVAAGAPSSDGKINLMHYAAWLVRGIAN